ncbi:MAG TPA: condensation domain-containing protein, partial [Candidatus Deferrimicrobium sp.]|nr:condensation domain-containing protein [Candidatus Deferrimicrobium sp.]
MHEQITGAVVLAREDSGGEKYLAAYFVSKSELKVAELRDYLSGRIPGYMIPSYFVRIEKIPLTANGKLDREALPQPGMKSDETYVAPRNEIEMTLVELWTEILGIQADIGIDDNFFALGGHSLKATVLAAKFRRTFNVEIPLAEIFKTPTIRRLAQFIATAQKTEFIDLIPVEEKEFYDLSYNQKRLWFFQQIEPHSSAFNMPGRILFTHSVAAEWIEKALAQVTRRHEGFRTAFKTINAEPRQTIAKEAGVTLNKVDLSSLVGPEKQQARERIFHELASAPFDLTQAPLFRAGLVKLTDREYEFIFNMHHIISDGLSMEILKHEFTMIYEGNRGGREVQLEPVTFQYKDFAAWHNNQLADSSWNEGPLRYWRNKLENGIPILELPGDYSVGSGAENKAAATWRFMIGKELKDKLKELAGATQTTLFMTLFSAYLLLLYRLGGREEVACSIIDSGRDHPSLHRVIGFFINSLIFKTTIVEGETFTGFLQRIRGDILEVFQHRNYPLELVFEQLNMKYPDIPVSFNLLNMQDSTLHDELTEFTPSHIDDRGEAKFVLEPYLCEYRNGIDMHWVYQKAVFKPETMAYIARAYIKTLEEISQNPALPVTQYRIFPAPGVVNGNEVRPVNAFPEFKKEDTRQSIGRRFEAIVKAYPDKIAVKFGAAVMSYDQLNRFANRVARLIKDYRSQTVALLFERSIEMTVGIMAALKAGKTYVPLDPSYPEERLEYMLDDSQAGLIITNLATVLINNAAGNIPIMNIDIMKGTPAGDENSEITVSPAELAYILYTSGSTGKPKGVMQNHGNVLHFARVYANALHIHPEDRLTLFSSYCFDAAKMDIYGALLNGATLYPFDIKKEESLSSLPDWLRKERITIFHSIPTVYRYFTEQLSASPGRIPFPHLRLIVLGGEAVYKKDVDNYKQYFPEHCLFINGLGPTE